MTKLMSLCDFSILGMQLFGCMFCDPNTGLCDRKNFDSLLWATVTVFQVSRIVPVTILIGDS